MPDASAEAYAVRDVLWQCLYTLFESLALCWQLEADFLERECITNFADYAWNLNAWTAFYAHLGRIHDMAERATVQLNEKRLYAPFDPFYERRHIALHGIKVPMRWVYNVLCAPPLGEANREWHGRMSWTELTKAEFNILSNTISSTLRELEPIIDFFFSQVIQLAPPRLGLEPICWPEEPVRKSTEQTLEIPIVGTQCCQSSGVESCVPYQSSSSGIKVLTNIDPGGLD
ncbi:MAG TPA: hypothetical protein VGO67_16375 [Verrucomicrobiae bacterium]